MSKYVPRPDGIYDPTGKYLNPLNGKPYTKSYLDKAKDWSGYQSWLDRDLIIQKIHNYAILVVILPTGAGKTVIIPKLLFHYFEYNKKILVATPRQATTSGAGGWSAICMDVPIYQVDSAGKQILDSNNEPIKSENIIVGYKYQGLNLTNKNTKLLFTTDGTIKMMLSSDPTLKEFGGIIIDEVHERSVNIDIVIALVMKIIPLRPDFKIIFMSATIDKTMFVNYFDRIGLSNNFTIYELPAAKSPYPVEKSYIQKVPKVSDMPNIIYDKINEIMLNPKYEIKDILAFVTSPSDIKKIKDKIDKNMKNYAVNNKPLVISFTKDISDEDKDIATKKGTLKNIPPTADAPQGYARKLMLATPVAESSITFSDPLVYVIDFGLAYQVKYSAKDYAIVSGKNYVSQASIKQRCGRTGRTNAGYCFQMYTESQYNSFNEFISPAIIEEDFTKELLTLSSLEINKYNVKNALSFVKNMIEPYKNYRDNVLVAYNNLNNMGLVNEEGQLTRLGYICNNFNKSLIDIKSIKMIIGGYYVGCIEFSMMLAAILNGIAGFDDVFRPIFDIDKKKADAQLLANKKVFMVPEGEHISLLMIFYNFRENQSKFDYCTKYGLNINTLNAIEELYRKINTDVINNKLYIQNLNLFNVPPEILIFGGGKSNNNNTYVNNNVNNNINNTNTTETGSGSTTNNNVFNNDNTGVIQNTNSNTELYDRNTKNDRSINNKNHHGKGKTKRKSTKQSIGKGRGHIKGKIVSKKYKSKKHTKHMFGGNNNFHNNPKPILADNKLIKRIGKLVDLLDFKYHMYSKPLTIPTKLFDKILACLFYGYSNHIAYYSGMGNNYNVKFSPKKGSIKDTLYYHLKQTPDILIYNQFKINAEAGRPETTSLSIISELKQKHISYFFNLSDLKEKIIS